MKSVNKIFSVVLVLLLPALLQGCVGGYSFTGAQLPPSITSISVQPFFNDTGSGPPDMAQNFTQRLQDYYQRNTNLALVSEDGDLQLEGAIVNWQLTPVAPTASGNNDVPDRAGLQRLTITVKVDYINTVDESQSFSKNFSFYDQYDPALTDLATQENQLINTIFETIVFDIFNSTVANW